MNREQILLTILAEECVETAQRATKAIRFGMQEIQRDQPLNNSQRIIYEFNDILAIMEMLKKEGYFVGDIIDSEAIIKKEEKIEKYLKYSKELGKLK